MLRSILHLVLLFSIGINGVWAQVVPDTPKVYSFAVLPQQDASTLASVWNPILQDISQRTGIQLRFYTAPGVPEFERRLSAGVYDFAYMNPYHYIVFNQRTGYQAFAKQADSNIRGILVVAKESGVTSIEQLKDQGLAFPSPAAFGASVLPRVYLTNNKVKFDPYYVGAHDSVYRGVARGLFSAGGGIERTLNDSDEKIRQELRILWRSNEYTSHAFAVKADVPVEVVMAVKQAMLAMSESDEGRALLAAIHFEGIVSAQDSDWDDVRGLGMRLLDALSQGQ